MKYSNEEKLSIITRYQQGERITALSNELAISRSTLYRWLKSFPSDSIGKPLKFSYQEYASLQRKVEKLQNIITILKSADCLVSAPLKERLHALEPFYGKYEVHTICEALDVDRGTFYNHILRSKRGNAWFDKRRQEYCQIIRDVFDEYRQVLGAEKIRTILIQRGHQVSAEYISQLMREMGLSSVRSTAKKEYLKLRETERKKNILQQQFTADQPNQRWVSDVKWKRAAVQLLNETSVFESPNLLVFYYVLRRFVFSCLIFASARHSLKSLSYQDFQDIKWPHPILKSHRLVRIG